MRRTHFAATRRILPRAGVAFTLVLAAQMVLLQDKAFAATINVTSTADVATNFGACGNTAQTVPTGTSLREAICAANNAGATSTTINVAAGTYHLTSGELQMGKVSGSNISLNGAGAASTIINAGGLSRVLDLDVNLIGGVTTSISGVTISGGTVTTFGGAGIIGGSGHATTGDTLSISNSTITGNTVNSTTSNKPGGGVQFEGGALNITNSVISSNNSGSSQGGGVTYTAEADATGEHLTITGTTFSANSVNASVANINTGGALAISSAGAVPVSVTNSSFVGNTVTGSGTGIPQGGGIFSQGGTLTVTGSTFTNNAVAGGSNPQGGAVSVLGGTAALHYNRIVGNTGATGSGVSLGVSSGATLDASENWWGCNTGPGTAGCDTAAGGPTVSPRLVLTASASPATVVGPSATSTITAGLTVDSLGGAIGSSNLTAFAGLPVSFSDPQPSGATLGSSSVNLAAGSASTSYNSQNTSGPGHALATLDNGTATATITVDRVPAITSTNAASFTVGSSGSFSVTTTGYPVPAIGRVGTLPSGLSFVDNSNGTATISGTPAAGTGGSYPLSLTASNGVSPNATQTLTVTVYQAPAITSSTTANFVVGSSGSFGVTTSGFPTVSTISEAGALPAGVSFTDNSNGTATLAGTPAAGTGGTYPVTVTASNGISPNATQSLTIQVNQAPAITTNPSDQTVAPSTSVSFIAAASGVPAPTVQWQVSTDGGVSFNNISGAVSTTYTFTAATTDNGNEYRAVFSNGVGSPATSTAATLHVGAAPTITSADHTSFVVGTPGNFLITTTGIPRAGLNLTGTVPNWIDLTDHVDGTFTLGGTPPAGSGGSYSFTLVASNGVSPAASQDFTLFVDESPTITSADHTAFLAGTSGTFSVTSTAGYPASTSLSETGALPDGVTFVDNGNGTATLSGTPTSTGDFSITITASNGVAPDASQTFTLTVDQFVFSPATSGTYGGSQTLSATGTGSSNPIVFSVDGSSGDGVCSLDADGVTLHYTGVGSCVVDASQEADGTHAAGSGQATVGVVAAPLTITANSPRVLLGATPPAITGSISGLVNGDSSAVVSGLSCATTATSTSTAGAYPTTCSGATAANYTISYVPGTLHVVTPYGVGRMGTSPKSVLVDRNRTTITFTYTGDGLGMVNGELIMTVPTGWTAPSTSATADGYTTSTCGVVSASGQTITITSVNVAPGGRCTVTYGSRAGGGAGATTGLVAGPNVFTTLQRSTARHAPAALATSPSVNLTARPVVLDLSPNTSPVAGGVQVTITGLYFADGDQVVIGQGTGPSSTAVPGTNVTVVSTTEITFVTGSPAHKGTNWIVWVIAPDGSVSPMSDAAKFSYT